MNQHRRAIERGIQTSTPDYHQERKRVVNWDQRVTDAVLWQQVSEETGVHPSEISRILKATFKILRKNLGERRSIAIYGFGSFIARFKNSYVRSGKTVKERFVVNFKPSEMLRRAMDID